MVKGGEGDIGFMNHGISSGKKSYPTVPHLEKKQLPREKQNNPQCEINHSLLSAQTQTLLASLTVTTWTLKPPLHKFAKNLDKRFATRVPQSERKNKKWTIY